VAPREEEDDALEFSSDDTEVTDGESEQHGIDEEMLERLKKEGLQNLQAASFTLGEEYAAWTKDGDPDKKRKKKPLRLEVTRGSDAHSERSALLTIAIVNDSDSSVALFARRELLVFEVLGPGGLAVCQVEEGLGRHPERQAFSTLRPGGKLTMVTRLREFCPSGTFSRPGFYLVSASFTAPYSGERFGLSGFTGTLATFRPKAVRIQTGEDPFLIRMPLRRGDSGNSDSQAPSAAPPPTGAPPPPPVPQPPPAPN
jgi:hypothetical protein